nr:hypothetical protein [Tanacetum cinerariifolium]
TGLRTPHPTERFVISSESSHDSNANDEVTPIVRSFVPPPHVFTAAVVTTIVAGATSAPVHESGTGQAQPSIFRDSSSLSTAEANVVGPSQPTGVEMKRDNESALDDPDVCRSLVDQLAPPLIFSQLRSMDYEQPFAKFNVGAARQKCLGAEVMMRLEHEIRVGRGLRGQVPVVEAARASELNGLKERNAVLEGQLSCDELSIKAASLESEKDGLVGQVSALEI